MGEEYEKLRTSIAQYSTERDVLSRVRVYETSCEDKVKNGDRKVTGGRIALNPT